MRHHSLICCTFYSLVFCSSFFALLLTPQCIESSLNSCECDEYFRGFCVFKMKWTILIALSDFSPAVHSFTLKISSFSIFSWIWCIFAWYMRTSQSIAWMNRPCKQARKLYVSISIAFKVAITINSNTSMHYVEWSLMFFSLQRMRMLYSRYMLCLFSHFHCLIKVLTTKDVLFLLRAATLLCVAHFKIVRRRKYLIRKLPTNYRLI